MSDISSKTTWFFALSVSTFKPENLRIGKFIWKIETLDLRMGQNDNLIIFRDFLNLGNYKKCNSLWKRKNCHFQNHGLWFYVHSILANFFRSETNTLTILTGLNFNIWEFHPWNGQKYPKIQNARNISLWGLKLTKNWFHVKSEWQKKQKISTLCPQFHVNSNLYNLEI